MDVEIVCFEGCPNVPVAREHLMQAFARLGRAPRWREWDRDDPASPRYVRGYASPTILVNGNDVTGAPPSGYDAAACRVYLGGKGGVHGAPAIGAIVSAVLKAGDAVDDQGVGSDRVQWRKLAAALPVAGAAALPKLACPACWPAYSSLLSAAGIGFANYTPYLLPLTGVLIVLLLVSLGWGAQRRHGYGPLWVGVVAAAGLMFGKFTFDSDAAMYAAMVVLLVASLWNAWPRSMKSRQMCPDCLPPDV